MEEQVILYILFALLIFLFIEQVIGLIKKIKGIPDKKYQIDVSIHYIDTDKKNER